MYYRPSKVRSSAASLIAIITIAKLGLAQQQQQIAPAPVSPPAPAGSEPSGAAPAPVLRAAPSTEGTTGQVNLNQQLDGRAAQESSAQPSASVPAANPVSPSNAPAAVQPDSGSAAQSVAAQPAIENKPKVWSDSLRIGGGATLWYYQPTLEGQKNNLEFFNAKLTLDADLGEGFKFYLEPRFRDTKLRSFFAGTAWIEQGYASYTRGSHQVKVGKVYSQLGLFWDNSFWGNVQVYSGLKLAPDYGASLEGTFEADPAWGVGYAAQFFLVDGSTNVSLPGRDTLSLPDSRRRNQVVLRAEPYLKFGADGVAKLGISGQRFEADSPSIPDGDVWRYAADVKVTLGGFGVWGEYLRQNGYSVSGYPYAGVPATDTEPAVPGRASDEIDYYLAGAEYTYWRVTARYNFSAARYGGVRAKEWMHVPALGFKINDNLQAGAEYVHWTRTLSGDRETYNRSLNLLLFAKF